LNLKHIHPPEIVLVVGARAFELRQDERLALPFARLTALRSARYCVKNSLSSMASWGKLAPRCHGALVRLGNGKPAVAVALPLLVGDKARWGRQHLLLSAGCDVMEVEVVAWTVELPCRCIIGVHGLVEWI
jgi:hypothetical protein